MTSMRFILFKTFFKSPEKPCFCTLEVFPCQKRQNYQSDSSTVYTYYVCATGVVSISIFQALDLHLHFYFIFIVINTFLITIIKNFFILYIFHCHAICK